MVVIKEICIMWFNTPVWLTIWENKSMEHCVHESLWNETVSGRKWVKDD